MGMVAHSREIFLVDAKNCKSNNKDTPNHSMEMRSLLAAQVIGLTVWYVCQDFKALSADAVIKDGIVKPCCESCGRLFKESPDDLPDYCPEHLARDGAGSGTPYVLVAKNCCRPLQESFPHAENLPDAARAHPAPGCIQGCSSVPFAPSPVRTSWPQHHRCHSAHEVGFHPTEH